MKKVFALILVLALCAAMSLTAFAEGTKTININGGSDTTKITARVNPSYIVTIPETVNVTFPEPRTALGEVELTKAQLEPGATVKVTATENAFVNKADSSKTIAYDIEDADGSFTGKSFTEKGDKVSLTIAITTDIWNTVPAGDYEGSVTFKIAYVPAV